ncbi:CDP-alcohol phosphatidyltransferase family protein [Balamuthia mandrillaris]
MLDQYLRRVKETVLIGTALFLGKYLSPNQLSGLSLAAGLASAWCLCQGLYVPAQLLWLLNRALDGLDGVVARLYSKQSDLGGYLDIIFDFVVYALIPVALVWSHLREGGGQQACGVEGWSVTTWELLAVALLEGVYFVNAASLFLLASILEKRSLGAKHAGELTTVTMPVGLIEGTETLAFYTLFIQFHQHALPLFTLFGGLVALTVLQRLLWAARHLSS